MDRLRQESSTPRPGCEQEGTAVTEMAGDGRIFRLAWPRLTLGTILAGTLLGLVGAIGLLLGWFGVSLEEVVPELGEGLLGSPAVLGTAVVMLGVLWLVGLVRSLAYEVEVGPGGAVMFRTLLRTVPAAADDPLGIDRLLGLLLVRAPGGQVVLLPELARMEPLLAHLEAHPTSSSDPRRRKQGPQEAAPEALPRVLLDTSVWRIVRTDSFAFRMALVGAGAGVLVPVVALFVFLGSEGPAIRPDGSVRPLAEIVWMVTIATLIPPLTFSPFVALRVARWRSILETGEPHSGWIDDVRRTSGELLILSSFERAGRTHRIRLLVLPTREAKALRPGAREVILVRSDRPRLALPQGLFVRRDSSAPGSMAK